MSGEVIALIDGSVYARSVCDHAVWAATRMGAGVALLHVLDERRQSDSHDLSGAIALGARSALLQEMADLDAQKARLAQKHGRAILEDAQEILREGGAGAVTTALRHGDLLEALADRETEAALVMIGKRGEAADFETLRLGANLEAVIRAAHHPVFVASRAFKPIEKALLAYDASASAGRAVEFAARSPLFDGLPIRLVTAGPESARAGLEAARDRLVAAGREAEAVLAPGKPEEALSRMIDEEGFGLLAMGAYGHGRLRSLLVGSTTAQMLRSCRAPVVMLR